MKKFFLLALVLAGILVFAGCQSQPQTTEPSVSEAPRQEPDDEILKAARELEALLQKAAADAKAFSNETETLRSLEEWEKSQVQE